MRATQCVCVSHRGAKAKALPVEACVRESLLTLTDRGGAGGAPASGYRSRHELREELIARMTQQTALTKDTERAGMRDLGLVAVGAALSKELRKQVLGGLEVGICCKEVDDLLLSIRMEKPEALKQWVEARGARLERGATVIGAITERLREVKAQAALKEMGDRIRLAAVQATKDEMLNELKSLIQEVEKL